MKAYVHSMLPWEIPCEHTKCCCKKRQHRKMDSSASNVHFKPYQDKPEARGRIIHDFGRLVDGKYHTKNTEGCHQSILHTLRYLMFSIYLLLFFPLFVLLLSLCALFVTASAITLSLEGICKSSRCSWCCFKSCVFRPGRPWKVNGWLFMTLSRFSELEFARFRFYRLPMFLWEWVTAYYWFYCRYFAGLFTANLWSDDMVIYFIHL